MLTLVRLVYLTPLTLATRGPTDDERDLGQASCVLGQKMMPVLNGGLVGVRAN